MIDAHLLRAERAERATLADLHYAAPPALRDDLGMCLEDIGGVLVSSARRGANIVVNRVVGLGVERPAARETVRAIVEHYRHEGIGRYFVHVDPAAGPIELTDWLEAEGLVPARAWAKFVGTSDPPPPRPSELDVRLIGPEHADHFGRIAAAAFDLGPRWGGVLAGLVVSDGWRVYMSFDGDEPAGCAAMRVLDGAAWFDWASTRPEFRRRGSQGAILARRVADARELGCDLLLTATGVAKEGDPQHSYRNIERGGFRLSHVRDNWAPEG